MLWRAYTNNRKTTILLFGDSNYQGCLYFGLWTAQWKEITQGKELKYFQQKIQYLSTYARKMMIIKLETYDYYEFFLSNVDLN